MTIGIDARLWNQTGIGRYIRNLVTELGKIDHENQYVLFCRPEDIEDIRLVVSSKQYVVIPTGIKWHSVSEQLEFPRLLNKYNLDLVHFPYFSVPIFYKKPYVVTVHDLIINHFPTGQASTLPSPFYKLKRMGYNYILNKAIHSAKKIIAPSNATRDEIIDHYKISKNKIAVTQEGVDPSMAGFAPVIFKIQDPYFLYVGNCYPHKNVEKLIDAFEIFSNTHPEYKLKLVGKSDFFYKRLRKKVNNKNIEFLGFVSDLELSKLYSQATATCVPSLMEGFGLTALEAIQMGSLVIVSKIPSLVEVCGKHAQYFDPSDTLSIVSLMEEVISLSAAEKKERVKIGQKHAETFSWGKTAQLTLDVYNSCL